MNESPRPVDPESVGRTAQIIVGSLMLGVLLMSLVAFFAIKGDPDPTPMLAFIGIGLGAIMLLARFTVPTIVVNASKAKLKQAGTNEQQPLIAGLYLSKLVIGVGLLEGAALFNLVAYMVEKQLWSCGVSAFLVVVMAFSFPSQGQFEDWAEEMKRELA